MEVGVVGGYVVDGMDVCGGLVLVQVLLGSVGDVDAYGMLQGALYVDLHATI